PNRRRHFRHNLYCGVFKRRFYLFYCAHGRITLEVIFIILESPNIHMKKYEYKYTPKNADVLLSIELNVFAVSALAFFVPIILGHLTGFPNQLIVGTLVNALLAYAALKFSFQKSLPIIILPALGALASGIIFGSYTIFLLSLVPFIWVGNAIYVFALKKLPQEKGFANPLAWASAIKAGFLFAATLALFLLSQVPAQFLLPMGIIQFVTALCGGALAGIVLKQRFA
ncbi:MAG: hypothetical protein NUV67_03765, partial [archaeon]|nr:hypothetical protein [archaeon]